VDWRSISRTVNPSPSSYRNTSVVSRCKILSCHLSTMSLFGNNQTANTGGGAPATGGGIFGNAGTQQQQPAGGGLFGSQNQGATQPTPSLFGNTSQPSQTPSIFGNPGASTNTSVAAGGLFGGQQQPQQPQTTTFGGQQQQPQPQATGGGLFGGASNQQPAGGGGLFGSTITQQPAATGGGLFGGTTTTQQPSTTGNTGLFGGGKPGGIFGSGLSINTNTTTPPSAPTTTTTNPLFGSTLGQQPQQQQQQPVASGGLFPQNQPQPPSLFGNLGQSINAPSGGSTMGTSTFNGGFGQSAGGLGASALSANSLLSTRGAGPPAQQQADAQAQQEKLMQRMESIYNAWNATSPQCRFQVCEFFVGQVWRLLTLIEIKHIFYNLVDPSQVSLYRQPPNVTAEIWEKATRENPDPTR
jgi:nuclear pore complex protein Nup54